ncbi:MAG: RnfABCDGE type electron transport complex subunit G [Bacteroidales bacterium]|nr:RnfABCDGE type electron transport complex subunit G [Bacteroidales bacterium]MBP5214837.1 RnfABCDGE type electron transport complex subunit G [Bacteroidales bacterium]MBP5764337.1 RnfABCDGE type electron transport complex subunit G [Bacteroidales bacterium]
MAKLENSLKNMVLSLTAITVIVGALLGYVASVTDEPIAQAAAAKQQNAIAAVVPVEGAQAGEAQKVVTANGEEAVIFPVTKDGQLVGHAVQAVSKNGFGGKITVMFGFDPEGTILGYNVLDCGGETPGLGAKMPDWFQKGAKGDVIGKNPKTNNLTVSKDEGEVDAITAATISSRAFCDAIAQAFGVLPVVEAAAEAQTSATKQAAGTSESVNEVAGE